MPRIGTRHEWEDARRALLEREKELMRRSDELAAARAELPWVPVEQEYVFDTEHGPRTLAELFDGRSQLLVQHLMYGPGWGEACVSCSSIADGIDLPRVHLEHHDVTFTAISRAPLNELLAYRERMGWSFPWASAYNNAFNFDFGVSGTDERPLRVHNWRELDEPIVGELPGMSAFALRDGVVYHTYSAYLRGLDALWSIYPWLDRAPLGRNEVNRDATLWLHRHDAYEAAVS